MLELEHYLDVLEIKPGAMRRAAALEQWRANGRWPECMDRFQERLEQRYGRRRAVQEMISLIRVGTSERQWADMIAAVEEGLRLGVGDAAAVLHIFRVPDAEQRRQHAMLLAEELRQFERPMPVMDDYDTLLSATAVIQ